MKEHFLAWGAVLLMVLTLCGCLSQENTNPYEVSHNGMVYTVDREQGTVSCDGIVYQFEVSRSGGDSVALDLTYPDGSSYYWSKNGTSGHEGWSEDYAPEDSGYVPGDVLCDVLSQEMAAAQRHSGLSPILAVLLLAVGAFQVISPRTAWMLERGWLFKEAEPTDLALAGNRAAGAAMIALGIICLLASF